MIFLLLAACGGGGADDTAPTFDPDPPTTLGGDRPAAVVLPDGYAVDREWPLVVLLHGYSANATLQDFVFGLGARQDDAGFVFVKPEGTVDPDGNPFWNATDACCDFYGSGVDDSAYLSGLITEARTLYPVSHVALVGHSNGAYMSYRMACDHPDQVDRIATLAGATYADESDCVGTRPVSVLHVHGTEDTSVGFLSAGNHAGAEETVGRWATKGGCDAGTVAGNRDYLMGVAGEETTVTTYGGCADGVDVQLWRAEGGDHTFLDNNASFKDDVARWVVQ